ncbi:MAG: ABC transporter ATP-binding protein [Magnetococcales bacterium]|nr:ABC transporter ATP-binding protein [Magnetococcales bacterium]
MIHLDRVCYARVHGGQTLHILKNISLSIARGEAVGLLGPSGSGKSSLLALLAGVEHPTQGHVQVNGVRLDGLSADALALFRRQHLGIVFQDFHLVPTLTAWENVALPLDLAGQPESRPRALEMLARMGLAPRSNHRPGELSGGEQQRVAIARAFISRPALILADEPTGNLDQDTSRQVIDLLFSCAAQWGSTLFLVTHDPQLAQRADRCLRLVDGQLTDLPAPMEQA